MACLVSKARPRGAHRQSLPSPSPGQRLLLHTVALKKECICQGGLLVINWAPNPNPSLATIAGRAFSCTTGSISGKSQTELRSLCTVPAL